MYNYEVNIFWTKEDMHYRLIAWKADKNLDYPFTSEFWKEIKKKTLGDGYRYTHTNRYM